MPRRELQCPNGCLDGRFEALNAPLIVDREARYVSHEAARATYVCVRCAAVALDVAAAARQMMAETDTEPATLVCPACGTAMLPPEDDPLAAVVECPACGQRFTVEEGTLHLHGGGPSLDEEMFGLN